MVAGALAECWLWRGSTDRGGYGILKAEGRRFLAHRVAYELAHGAPLGVVRHTCDTPACQNPAHLRDGTQADNVRDREQRGRSTRLRGEANGMAKLTEAQVREVRAAYAAGEPIAAIARRYGRNRQTIAACAKGQAWRHVQ